MRNFRCACGNRLFFDNSQCVKCGRDVAFLVGRNEFYPLGEPGLVPCENYGKGLCNWFVEPGRGDGPCLACRLNIEDGFDSSEGELLANAEKAKRRLVFSLLSFGLPVVPKSEDERGLGFTLRRSTPEAPVTTGHADGLITLDLNEADPSKREEIRKSLGESYRTLLGHFRHEAGHYYFQLIFGDDGEDDELHAAFRGLFGDERADYAAALKAHYGAPNLQYQDEFVSSYASSHPWEDWAETWAHYFHIRDSWETAVAFGLRPPVAGGEASGEFEGFLSQWAELMIALNAMNRSMGHADAYPFQFTPKVCEKLGFVHGIIDREASRLRQLFESLEPGAKSSRVNAAPRAMAETESGPRDRSASEVVGASVAAESA